MINFKSFLKYLWWLMLNTGYLLSIIVLAYCLFTQTDQSRDFVFVLIQGKQLAYELSVYFGFLIWSFLTWYSAAVILQLAPTRDIVSKHLKFIFTKKVNQLLLNALEETKVGGRAFTNYDAEQLQKESTYRNDLYYYRKLKKVVPCVLGLMPMVVLWLAIHSTQIEYSRGAFLWWDISILIGIIFMGFMLCKLSKKLNRYNEEAISPLHISVKRDKGETIFSNLKTIFNVPRKTLMKWPTENDITLFYGNADMRPSVGAELRFMMNFKYARRFFFYVPIIGIILIAVFSIPAISIPTATFLRPANMLLFILIFITTHSTIVYYFHDLQRRPFAIIIVLFTALFSIWNDNSEPNLIANKKLEYRNELNPAFEAWASAKWVAQNDKSKPIQVYFIATQGGGSRGLYFTCKFLDSVNTIQPQFIDHTFVISGVSGGGVGALIYLNYFAEKQKGAVVNWNKFRPITTSDYLSPLTASFAFGETVQRFLPFPVSKLDRCKVMANNWEQLYKSNLGSNQFAAPFHNLWYSNNAEFNTQIPSIVLNGTLAETGQRVLTSNLSFANNPYFKGDLEYFEQTGKDISSAMAALNTCRFPVLMNGALMKNNEGYEMGHIVDGGYRENTGLQTLYNILLSLQSSMDKLAKEGIKIQPVVIYLKNGTIELPQKYTATRLLHDAITPVKGIVNVNGSGIAAYQLEKTIEQNIKQGHLGKNTTYYCIWLENRDSKDIQLPLAWSMSSAAVNEIDKRVGRMDFFDRDFLAAIRATK